MRGDHARRGGPLHSGRSLDAEAARATVISDLRLLRTQFDALPSITEEIDARNARFSGVALRKLTYLLRQDRRIETSSSS